MRKHFWLAPLAAGAAYFTGLPAALADACAKASEASTGAMGGPVSSAAGWLLPAVTVGAIAWAARRLKK